MANAGAIATTSLVPGTTIEAKWKSIHEGLSRFAGRELTLNEEVYACALQTNYATRASRGCCRALAGSISIRNRQLTSTPGNALSM